MAEDAARKPIVVFRGVSKFFGEVAAASDISLEVAAGEFLSLSRAVRLRQDHLRCA